MDDLKEILGDKYPVYEAALKKFGDTRYNEGFHDGVLNGRKTAGMSEFVDKIVHYLVGAFQSVTVYLGLAIAAVPELLSIPQIAEIMKSPPVTFEQKIIYFVLGALVVLNRFRTTMSLADKAIKSVKLKGE